MEYNSCFHPLWFFHINLVRKRVKLNPTVPNTFPNPSKVQVTSLGGRTSCEIQQALVLGETGGDAVLQPRTTRCPVPCSALAGCRAALAPGQTCCVAWGSRGCLQHMSTALQPRCRSTALPGVCAGRDSVVLQWEREQCTRPAQSLHQGFLWVIVPAFKLNYFASTSFLHFSEGGRGVCKEC